MRVQIISDLHMEFHKDCGLSFAESQDSSGVDLLLLVGDIFVLSQYSRFKTPFQLLCEMYPKVLFVAGNHEYYQGDAEKMDSILCGIESSIGNLTVLKNNTVMIDNQRFVGGTLWFPDKPDNIFYQQLVNDFKVISNFVPWVYRQNEACVNTIKTELKNTDVLVTHHLPTYDSVSPQYENSALNRFFVTELGNLIADREPKLAVHGHSHDSVDYKFCNTRVLSNPYGYVGEINKKYIERCIAEV